MEWVLPYSIVWLLMTTKLAVVVADGIGKKLSSKFGDGADGDEEQLKILATNTKDLRNKMDENGANLFRPLIMLMTIVPAILNMLGCFLVEEYVNLLDTSLMALWCVYAVDAMCWAILGLAMLKTVKACASDKHDMNVVVRYMRIHSKNKFFISVRIVSKVTTTIMFLAALQLFMHLFL